ncbi:hypothetical protein D7I44_16385 [Gryllotalpicola protaetiae]|uniref:Uncharacterized protein n=1 Tax=Gryllotalpicola protaetiae TaxID=2419771 RepID=A0A387BMA1_9MICO|nr:hypothetical protein D7I44_16385 [Gryllotalpicola protaetiae]
MLLWCAVAAAVLAVVALLLTGRLNAPLLPHTVAKPAPLSVQCFDTDGELISGWTAHASDPSNVPRVDPLSVCTAIEEDAQAVAQLDQIAVQQRTLGNGCVTFSASDGGRWALTDVVSANGTYTASGGPAPGRLPSFGEVEQPAPIAKLAPLPAQLDGCVELPKLTWKLALPPLAACTADGLTVSVYPRKSGQSAAAACAAKDLVVAAG